MKIRFAYILIMVSVLGIGVILYFQHRPSSETNSELSVQENEIKVEKVEPKQDISKAHVPIPPTPNPEPADTTPAPQKPNKMTADRRRAEQNWKNAIQRFEQQQGRLSQEEDQARRMNLIRTMAMNVRIDTLSTLDWAMSLENPDERRAALEAINKNALTGVGVEIIPDKTGLPKIHNTTLLGAVAASGKVEPGDYISGMVNEDGSTTSFKGLSLREIAQMLRGPPGTDEILRIQRNSEDGTESNSFDVPVKRSLIVVDPPF